MICRQQLLFIDDIPAPERRIPVGLAPYQPKSPTSRLGAEHIAPRAATLNDLLLRTLREAGPVRSGGAIGGRTIQELAKVLTEQRGRLVKEGTVCGRLAELRRKQLVSDSGAKRPGACGVPCTVYVHHEHVQPNRPNSNDAGQRTPTRQERLAELRKRIRALFYQRGIEVCGPVFAEQDLAFVGAVDRIADPRRLEAILEALQASAKQERNSP